MKQAGGADRLHELITLKQAAAELPSGRPGKRRHVASLYRYTDPGLHGVRLRYVQVGSTRCTTREWLHEFFEALAEARDGKGAPDLPVAPASRRRAIEAADREAAALGM